mmetsp:Transcript_43673/g.116727  ORF Transcript_43673/g.116727 Transcript_43673/m.116727 type:complete len:257 (-) Transcript_43673:353-1123(-)
MCEAGDACTLSRVIAGRSPAASSTGKAISAFLVASIALANCGMFAMVNAARPWLDTTMKFLTCRSMLLGRNWSQRRRTGQRASTTATPGLACPFSWVMRVKFPRYRSRRRAPGSSRRAVIRPVGCGPRILASASRSSRATTTRSSPALSTTRATPSSQAPRTTPAEFGSADAAIAPARSCKFRRPKLALAPSGWSFVDDGFVSATFGLECYELGGWRWGSLGVVGILAHCFEVCCARRHLLFVQGMLPSRVQELLS